MTNLSDLAAAIEAEDNPKIKKDLVRKFIAAAWPGMPSWSTLEGPEIQEVGTYTNGCGGLVTFMLNGKRKVLLGQAGEHYGADDARYTIPGGFANPDETPGSTLVAASKDKPENAFEASAREIEEEFRLPDGSPFLNVDPVRLKPLDTDTLRMRSGERRIVMSQSYELNADEVGDVLEHLHRMDNSPAYREAVKTHTINSDTGKPEIETLKIFDLDDVAAGDVPLMHADQMSLFRRAKAYYDELDNPHRRAGATAAYRDKVKTLEELSDVVAQWRAEGAKTIGFTSGVYDILHPGHFSFLNDCYAMCDRLVVVIASDRTVSEAKGADKPIFTEDKRAQSIAELMSTDAVIVSDEKYHETILRRIGFDIMFKGDDYAGRDIKGADLAGRLVLIPCAEKVFNSSSAVIRAIREGVRDEKPSWGKGPAVTAL